MLSLKNTFLEICINSKKKIIVLFQLRLRKKTFQVKVKGKTISEVLLADDLKQKYVSNFRPVLKYAERSYHSILER